MFWPSKAKSSRRKELKEVQRKEDSAPAEAQDGPTSHTSLHHPLLHLPSLSQLDSDVVASLPLAIRKELEMEYRKSKREESSISAQTSLTVTAHSTVKGITGQRRQKTLQDIGCVSKPSECHDLTNSNVSGKDEESLFHQLDPDLLFALPSQIIEENLKAFGHTKKDIQKTLEKRRNVQNCQTNGAVDSNMNNLHYCHENERAGIYQQSLNHLSPFFFQTETIDHAFRSIVQRWMKSISSPSLIHRTLLAVFLHQLLLEKNLEDLQRMLNIILRISKECTQWSEVVDFMVEDIQKKMVDEYQSVLKLDD